VDRACFGPHDAAGRGTFLALDPAAVPATGLQFARECRVVVLSEDAAVRDEVTAAVADAPGVVMVCPRWNDPAPWGGADRNHVLVIDDEGHEEAVQCVEALKAVEPDTAVIYIAAQHTLELERQVRQAGVTYYAEKASRGRNVGRTLAGILRTRSA
jgi:DNA-binding NtrC family response regulator